MNFCSSHCGAHWTNPLLSRKIFIFILFASYKSLEPLLDSRRYVHCWRLLIPVVAIIHPCASLEEAMPCKVNLQHVVSQLQPMGQSIFQRPATSTKNNL